MAESEVGMFQRMSNAVEDAATAASAAVASATSAQESSILTKGACADDGPELQSAAAYANAPKPLAFTDRTKVMPPRLAERA